MSWRAEVIAGEVHVYPKPDAGAHELSGTCCGCDPRVDFTAPGPFVVHAAYDGRPNEALVSYACDKGECGSCIIDWCSHGCHDPAEQGGEGSAAT